MLRQRKRYSPSLSAHVRRGTAVLLISDDVEELRVCHRVLVIFQGRIVRAFGHDWTERELIASIEGVVS
jgi:simple sugar transport system ATP-binding protein